MQSRMNTQLWKHWEIFLSKYNWHLGWHLNLKTCSVHTNQRESICTEFQGYEIDYDNN